MTRALTKCVLPLACMLAFAVCLCGVAPVANAQSVEGTPPPAPPQQGYSTQGVSCASSSPFLAPEATGTLFVAACGPGLDTGCTYRSESPLVLQIPVTRFVGPTNADGYLRNTDAAIQAGLLPRFATLRLPVFDIDYDGGGTSGWPERDRVYFNGIEVDVLDSSNSPYLLGADGAWRLNTYKIPIDAIRFPTARGAIGSSPVPAINELRIDIDTWNPGHTDQWCMSVDWAALEVKCYSPIVVIPGNSLDGAYFVEEGFTQGIPIVGVGYFHERIGIQRDASLRLGLIPTQNNLNPLNQVSVAKNAERIQQQLWPIVQSFGATSVHLVQHSKGGLDTREYLQKYYASGDSTLFKVISYTSLGSPHDGSFLADYMVAKDTSAEVAVTGLTFGADVILGFKQSNDGYPNLQVSWVSSFNARNIPALKRMQENEDTRISYHAVCANMDKNLNRVIDHGEWETLSSQQDFLRIALSSGLELPAREGVDAIYHMLATTSAVVVVTGTQTRTKSYRGESFEYTVPVVTITVQQGQDWKWNDSLVTTESGIGQTGGFNGLLSQQVTLSGPTAGRNHADIGDSVTGALVSRWIMQSEYPNGLK